MSGDNTDLGRDRGRCCGTFKECESRKLEETRMNSSPSWEIGIKNILKNSIIKI